MASEDDTQSSHVEDVDYMEEDYYYSEDEDVDYAEEDYYSEGEDETQKDDAINHAHKRTFTVLDELDIRQRQEEQISKVTGVLSVSSAAASVLLHHFGWNVTTVNEEWFKDEESVRKATGLLEQQHIGPPCSAEEETTCKMCYEDHSRAEMTAAACRHLFCRPCWSSYIAFSIANGPGCLTLRCPIPSCDAAVGQDMVDELGSDADKDKYSRYLIRSYIECNKKTKWCPAPGCEFAVELAAGSESYDVLCNCSYAFCWKCTEELHRPVDCETVAKWVIKNSSEAENTTWILANSKQCPKCCTPIEKNQGCMHMTCRRPCRHQFCWLCLGPWEIHTDNYKCNIYNEAVKEGKYSEEERRREMAKAMSDKYAHYYERWAGNHASRQRALLDLQAMRAETLQQLSDKIVWPVTQVEFLLEAWVQIVECRRVLKWTYAYGYYLPDDEKTKKHFFEYLQHEAEAGLERLHHCTEMELRPFLEAEAPSQEEFDEFRVKLLGLTRVTGTYFQNLVRALEAGLHDVQVETAATAEGVGTSARAAQTASPERRR